MKLTKRQLDIIYQLVLDGMERSKDQNYTDELKELESTLTDIFNQNEGKDKS